MPPAFENTARATSAMHLGTQGVPSAANTGASRRWLRLAAILTVVLFLALCAGLLLAQREAALARAEAQANHEVRRLAAELQASLRAARAMLNSVRESSREDHPQVQSAHDALIHSLSLPFSLTKIDPPAGLPDSQWRAELPRQEHGRWVIPMAWRQSNGSDSIAVEALFDRDAMLERFAFEGLPPKGSMILFRVEDDGGTRVLTRYPFVEQEQGRLIHGHVSTALNTSDMGVMQVDTQIDGVRRVVGYQRLTEGAGQLVILYALPVQAVLANWMAALPLAIALILLLAAAMVYGAWRLDRAIAALGRSERKFQTLAEHMPDVVLRCAQDGRVLYINPAVKNALGIAPELLESQALANVGASTTLTRKWMAILRRTFETGQAETLHFAHTGPAGKRHWEARFCLENGSNGEAQTTLILARDITDRVEAERRQMAAQRLFETIFHAAPEPIVLSELKSSRMVQVNDAFCEISGWTRGELIGRSALDLGLWPLAEMRKQLLQSLALGKQVRSVPGRIRRPDGEEIHVRFSAERVLLDDRECLLLMSRDVTELEREQRALAQSELRFRLAAAHGQVWEWDFGRGGIHPSDEFFMLLGHPAPAADQIERQFFEIIHPEDVPRLQKALHHFLKGEGEYGLQFRARDAAGEYRWFDTRGSGIRDTDGRVTYMAGTTFEITARKYLEEAQRQTIKDLDTLANASSVFFWTTNATKRSEWHNRRWLEFTHHEPQDENAPLGTADMHPDDRARWTEVFNAAFDARQPYSIEYRLRRHDGEYHHILEQGQPRYDADDRFIGYVGSGLDVTELRAAEDVAREKGAMLGQVFSIVKDMLFVLDSSERFQFFAADDSAGLYRKPAEFLGQPLDAVMPPDLVSKFRPAMLHAKEHGTQEVDYSLTLPDGPHHFNARLAWLPGGDRCMFLVRDTTEQQAMQQARIRSNDFALLLFRLASRFINLPVGETDEAIDDALGDMGRFVDADRAYLFNYDFLKGTGTNTHEWCADGVTREIDKLQDSPMASFGEWVTAHQAGKTMYVPDVMDLSESPLKELLLSQGVKSLIALPLMHEGRCLGFVGLDSVRQQRHYGEQEAGLLSLFAQMLVNIRLRVEAQARIDELTVGLERKVAERTAQLQESVQELTAVNQELESFNYSASHDLRTPLRGIEGFSSLLLAEHADQLDSQGRHYLERIQRATHHMSRLVSDLLAYSRLQQMTERIEPVGIESTVRAVLLPFKDELTARGGEVAVNVPTGLAVRADTQGLALALRNLIDNALKFIPGEREPLIRVEASVKEGWVHLRVADNGIGFDMAHRDQIFGMFQRLHRQDQIPGTGIGLAMVKKAVERMGGRIEADGVPDEGASFDMILPDAS